MLDGVRRELGNSEELAGLWRVFADFHPVQCCRLCTACNCAELDLDEPHLALHHSRELGFHEVVNRRRIRSASVDVARAKNAAGSMPLQGPDRIILVSLRKQYPGLPGVVEAQRNDLHCGQHHQACELVEHRQRQLADFELREQFHELLQFFVVQSHARGNLAMMTSSPSTLTRWFVFAAVVLIGHHWWPILHPFRGLLEGTRIATYIDLVTPLAIIGAATWILAAEKLNRVRTALFVVAAVMYVEGRCIHLAANSINNNDPVGEAAVTAHFWDETFSHALWYSGWMLMTAVVVWNGGGVSRAFAARVGIALLYGLTITTNAIEGGTVPMMFVYNVVIFAMMIRTRRGLQLDAAIATGSSVLLLIIFGLWQGGYPQFSELGWL
jgi:hypothetical protein